MTALAATIEEDALRIIGERDRALARAARPVRRTPLAEPRWHAVLCAPCQESTAATWLTRAGYYVAYPFDRFQRRRKQPHGRSIVEWVERPRFPRYIFVALRYVNEAIGPINAVKGVSRLVCRRLSGEPLQIPSRVMDALLDERLFSLEDEQGGVVMSETHLHGDRELTVFMGALGRWKCERVAA